MVNVGTRIAVLLVWWLTCSGEAASKPNFIIFYVDDVSELSLVSKPNKKQIIAILM